MRPHGIRSRHRTATRDATLRSGTKQSGVWFGEEEPAMKGPGAKGVDTPEGHTWDCIVVGAGCAGMAAAHRLALERGDQGAGHRRKPPPWGFSLLVLEAGGRVGGRTRNHDLESGAGDAFRKGGSKSRCGGDPSGHVIELGGTWLSPEHTAAIRLCTEHLGLELFRGWEGAPEEESGSNPGEGCGEPMPWWYWGVDYADEDMARLERTILHRDVAPSVDGDTGSASGQHPSAPITFVTPAELLESLDPLTVRELRDLGNDVIDRDVEALARGRAAGTSLWELPEVPPSWGELDGGSTADRALPLLSTSNGRNILRNTILNKNAEEPGSVGYLYNLISWSGSNSRGPDTEYRVVGGTQAIPLRIAEKLSEVSSAPGTAASGFSRCKVLLNTPVKAVAREHGNDRRFLVTTENGKRFLCRNLLVTGSPSAIHETIDFGGGDESSCVLPLVQKELLSPLRMPMGRSSKFFAIYRRNGPWWRKFGLQGDVLACGGLPEELSIRIPSTESAGETLEEEAEDRAPLFPCCFDVSPRSRKYGVLCCFLEGVSHRYFGTLSSEAQNELLTRFLELSFKPFLDRAGDKGDDGSASKSQSAPLWVPDEFLLADWGPETRYVGGAYTGYFRPGVLSQPEYWTAYRKVEKSPNLFWAGADYHAGFGNGYIEGAVRSGQHAADLIRERLPWVA